MRKVTSPAGMVGGEDRPIAKRDHGRPTERPLAQVQEIIAELLALRFREVVGALRVQRAIVLRSPRRSLGRTQRDANRGIAVAYDVRHEPAVVRQPQRRRVLPLQSRGLNRAPGTSAVGRARPHNFAGDQRRRIQGLHLRARPRLVGAVISRGDPSAANASIQDDPGVVPDVVAPTEQRLIGVRRESRRVFVQAHQHPV
jgi:hypothetical protein